MDRDYGELDDVLWTKCHPIVEVRQSIGPGRWQEIILVRLKNKVSSHITVYMKPCTF
jgi:hypothetical protein